MNPAPNHAGTGTPRTDAATRTYETGHGRSMDFDYVDPEDMASLERDLTALQTHLEEARKALTHAERTCVNVFAHLEPHENDDDMLGLVAGHILPDIRASLARIRPALATNLQEGKK